MYKLRTVIWDTYKRNVKNWSFISMVISPILILGVMMVVFYFISKPDTVKNTAVLSNDDDLIEYLSENQEGFNIISNIESQEQAENSIINGDIESYFVIINENNRLEGSFVSTTPNDTLLPLISSRIDLYNIESLDIEESELLSTVGNKLNSENNITEQFVYIREGAVVYEEEGLNTNAFISSTMILLVFLFVMNYSIIIGQEIGSEKGSKMMEIILSSTSSTKYLIGKLLSIALMCFTQLIIYLILASLAFITFGNSNILYIAISGFSFDLLSLKIIVFNIVYFVLSVTSFTLIAVMLSSLVTKSEDTVKALQPLTLLGMGGFYLGMFMAQSNPTNYLIKILSHIPLFSNFTMPFRISSSTVGGWEILLSLIIYTTFIGLLFLLTTKVYNANILSDRSNHNIFTQLFKSLKMIIRREGNFKLL